MTRATIASLFLSLLFIAGPKTRAHEQSEAFLNVSLRPSEASFCEVALEDLEHVVGLDANADERITWGEVRAKDEAIKKYVSERIELRIGGEKIKPEFTKNTIVDRSHGKYVALQFAFPSIKPGQRVEIRYNLLFDVDLQHRGLLRVSRPEGPVTHAFSPEDRTFSFISDR